MTQTAFIQIPLELIEYVRSLKLSGTQYDLWLYLYGRDPYGDRFCDIPSPAQIAAELNVDPRTIQRAAQRLQDADLFDFQIDSWKCKNTTSNTKTKNFSSDKKIPNRTKRSRWRQNDPVGDKMIQLPESGSNDPNDELEASSEADSRPPQTYSDFIQTLSEDERENFLNFVQEQIKNLPKPVNDLEAWLANQNQAGQNRWEVYYHNFLASQQAPEPDSSRQSGHRVSEIQAKAAQCRQKFQEEIEQQRIAAERAFAEQTLLKAESLLAEGSLDEKIFTTRDEREVLPPHPTPDTPHPLSSQKGGNHR